MKRYANGGARPLAISTCCGEDFFQLRLLFDRPSLTRWRLLMDDDMRKSLWQESLAVADHTEAKTQLSRAIIHTTIQPKYAMFPIDTWLTDRVGEILVRNATKHKVPLRQSYRWMDKSALINDQGHACSKRRKRANLLLKAPRTYLSAVIR